MNDIDDTRTLNMILMKDITELYSNSDNEAFKESLTLSTALLCASAASLVG